MPQRFARLAIAPAVGVVLFSVACASAPAQPTAKPNLVGDARNWSYALVIDASSSASSLQIFEWLAAEAGGMPQVVAAPRARTGITREPWKKRVKPGLGHYRGRPLEAAASLEPLIEYALAKIGSEPETLARTSLFLRASAGIRLLDRADQVEILAGVDDYLATTPFASTSARVITGVEEGIYGWIAVNYLLGNLLDVGDPPTVGALDLGGASTQITFEPLEAGRPPSETITLGPNTYHLYAKSYLGLGQDRAREIVASPACFLVGYPTTRGPGTGDFEGCRDAIRAALVEMCSEDEARCSLFGSSRPPLYGDFLALSVYAYAADFFGLGERLKPEDLETAGRSFCARDWQRWVADEPDVVDNPYLPNYCYSAAHIVTLLTEGFGFRKDTERIKAPLRVLGTPLDWTLGALVYELAGGTVEAPPTARASRTHRP